MVLEVSIYHTWIATGFRKMIQGLAVLCIPTIDLLQQLMFWKLQAQASWFLTLAFRSPKVYMLQQQYITNNIFLNNFEIMKINKLQIFLLFRRGNGMAVCWNHSIFRQRRWNTMVQSFPKRRSRYTYTSQCVSSITREQMDWKQMDRVQFPVGYSKM